jgi:endonuclease YncB( thermonuclease family)
VWFIAASLTLGIGLLLSAVSGRLGPGDDDSGSSDGAPIVATYAYGTPATVVEVTSLDVLVRELNVDPSQVQHATVVRVIDGDTIVVSLNGVEEHVRYYGIDTPEQGDGCYSQATDRNRQLTGTEVLLVPDARERDRYDRLLRYVFDTRGGSIDAQLIAEGYARAWTEDGADRDALIHIEDVARTEHIGCLWSD